MLLGTLLFYFFNLILGFDLSLPLYPEKCSFSHPDAYHSSVWSAGIYFTSQLVLVIWQVSNTFLQKIDFDISKGVIFKNFKFKYITDIKLLGYLLAVSQAVGPMLMFQLNTSPENLFFTWNQIDLYNVQSGESIVVFSETELLD